MVLLHLPPNQIPNQKLKLDTNAQDLNPRFNPDLRHSTLTSTSISLPLQRALLLFVLFDLELHRSHTRVRASAGTFFPTSSITPPFLRHRPYPRRKPLVINPHPLSQIPRVDDEDDATTLRVRPLGLEELIDCEDGIWDFLCSFKMEPSQKRNSDSCF